jgi:YD repeat-containing protein
MNTSTLQQPFLWIVIRLCVGLSIAQVPSTNGAVLDYSHDPLNRLTNAAYSDGSREAYTYDPAGNRLSRITLSATTNLDAISPSVPTNLTSLAFVPSQLQIGWKRSQDAGGSGLAGYFVYVNGTRVASVSSTNFLLTGLALDTEYCLTVAAYDHSTNVSAQSVSLCLHTPVFDPPLLTPLGLFGNGTLQIGILDGTPGPYDALVSTNLPNWQVWTNLFLPLSGGILIDPAVSGINGRFYRLRWSTNATGAPVSP